MWLCTVSILVFQHENKICTICEVAWQTNAWEYEMDIMGYQWEYSVDGFGGESMREDFFILLMVLPLHWGGSALETFFYLKNLLNINFM